MSRRLAELTLSVVLTSAIVVMAVVFVHREFFSSTGTGSVPPPAYVAAWRDLAAYGRVEGDSGAPVQIVEFGDLQCPACRGYQEVLRAVRKRFGNGIAVRYIHFPLSYHRQAYPAARAAECAGQLGRFEKFVDNIYSQQDSLGKKPWAAFAAESGVEDGLAFQRCVTDTSAVPAIERGRSIGATFGVDATPTLLVNGWRYRTAPSERVLVRLIKEIKAGKKVPALPDQDTASALLPTHVMAHGVLLLSHPADAFRRAPQFGLAPTPDAEIGGAQGAPLFDLSDATSFSLLSDAQVATFSPQGARLFIFRSDGTGARRIGRQGEGPGEFRGVPNMTRIRGDTLLLPDMGLMRLNWVRASQGVVHSEPLEARLPPGVSRVAGELSDGSVVLSSSGRIESGTLGRVTRPGASVVLLPPKGAGRVITKVPDVETARIDTRYEGRKGTEDVPVGFGRSAHIAVWDSFVVTAQGDGYRIELRSRDGALRAVLSVGVPRRVVTAAMRRDDIARQLDVLHGYKEKPRDLGESERIIRQTPYVDSLPPYGGLYVSSQGMLWILDPDAPGDLEWNATAFRRDGAIVMRLHGPMQATPVAFGDDRVLLRAVDADGVVSLVVKRFRREVGSAKP